MCVPHLWRQASAPIGVEGAACVLSYRKLWLNTTEAMWLDLKCPTRWSACIWPGNHSWAAASSTLSDLVLKSVSSTSNSSCIRSSTFKFSCHSHTRGSHTQSRHDIYHQGGLFCMAQPRGSDFKIDSASLQGPKEMVEVQRSHLDKPVLFHKHSSQNRGQMLCG